jgi:hypothetical protein
MISQETNGNRNAARNILIGTYSPWMIFPRPIGNIASWLLKSRRGMRPPKSKAKTNPTRNQKIFRIKMRSPMHAEKRFSLAEAKEIGDALVIDWHVVGVEQFQIGLEVELEHGARDTQTNVTNDDALITGKIALAHLKEFPDYYTRLSALEIEADEYWANV